MQRLVQNDIIAWVSTGTTYVIHFEVNGQKISRDHEDFEHYRSLFNAPSTTSEPARSGVEL